MPESFVERDARARRNGEAHRQHVYLDVLSTALSLGFNVQTMPKMKRGDYTKVASAMTCAAEWRFVRKVCKQYVDGEPLGPLKAGGSTVSPPLLHPIHLGWLYTVVLLHPALSLSLGIWSSSSLRLASS